MRALNSLAAKMSEKWEILHFPLLKEKTSFIGQQRHDKVRGWCRGSGSGWVGVVGAHVDLIRNSHGIASVGGGKHWRPVLTLQRRRREARERSSTTQQLWSVCCSNRNPTWCLPHKPLPTCPPTQQMSRSSEYIPNTTSCVWLYQNKLHRSSAELNGLTERHSIALPHP